MPFIALVLTFPLLYISVNKERQVESFYFIKLSAIWFSCQLYVTVNGDFRFPIGILCAFLFAFYSKTNRNSKLLAFGTGVVSFLISILVYFIYRL